MSLEPVSDGKEIVTLMCGNKTKTSVCAESLVFTCVLVWCSPVVDEASQFIMSTWDGLVRDVTMSQWGWMRRKTCGLSVVLYRYMNYGLCVKTMFSEY